MDQTRNNNNANEAAKGGPKTVAGYLVSALDMEEQIANGVYGDYLDPKSWPAGLSAESLEKIKAYLTTLIEDTEKHIKWLSDLNRLYGHDK